jgi:pimeloyl-ACP methyl ester carboxylesterase
MSQPKVATVESGFAEVNGGRLWYEVAGTGAPVVLIHSGITDSRSWDSQFQEFARSHRVVRYDMRGFGQSDVPHGAYSPVSDLAELLTGLGIQRAALVGVSTGGALAIDMTLTHSEMVSALVLVGAGLIGDEPSPEFAALMAGVDEILERDGLDAAVERELEILVYGKGRTAPDVDPAVREAVREMDRYNSARYPQDAKPSRIDPPAAGRLHEIRVPTLIIAGDREVDRMLDAAERLAGGIGGSRSVVMEGVAHVPNMERPQDFNRLVADFLTSVAGPA